MPHDQLLVEDHPAGYRWLRLDRPERRNALDPSLMAAVRDALAAEPGTLAVLGSTDPQVFCAGADVTWMSKTVHYTEEENLRDAMAMSRMFAAINELPVAVIGRIQGAALGGGAGLDAGFDRFI